jgi:putative heme-binding domain-containing protein
MGLALSPGGENWPYIVRTLGLLEPAAAPGILERLTTVDERPAEAEPYRNLIVLGLRMKEKEAPSAVKLLEHWLGESLGTEEETPAEKLVHWQEWYAEEFPDAPVAELPQVTSNQTWSYEQLHQFLIKAPERKGNVTRGKEAYAKAQCAKCHKAGSQGESIGPDLTTVNKRFSRKEMLESIYFPSHIISDQYKSKTVSLKDGRSLSGILAPAGASQFTLTNAKGERSTIQKAEIEEVETGKLSIMPDGLLNDLNQQEIEDLFAFLAEPAATKSTKTAKKKTGSTKR